MLASGVDSSAYQGALFNSDTTKFSDSIHSGGPHLLSVGASMEQQKRTLNTDGLKSDIKISHMAGIVGVDVTKWLTLYGAAGSADITLPPAPKDSNFEWTVGGTIRALDCMVLEPWNDIDQYWVGIDLNSFYRDTRVDNNLGQTEDLTELFGSCTLNIYSQHDANFLWNRLGFFFGPAISLLSKGNANEDRMLGFVGGLQLNPTPNWGIKLELQKFEEVGAGASILFHF